MPYKNILITGGAGFVGANLARQLIASQHNVLILDDLSTGLRSNIEELGNCELIEGSLEDNDIVQKSVNRSDYIVHLGARGSVPRSIKNPRATLDVNLGGTLNLLEAARENKTPVLFSSSSSVYGRNVEIPKKEKMWTAPITPYAASKLAAEALVGSYGQCYSLPILVFRFFNIFGPFQRPDHNYAAVIPKWIWRAMNKQPLVVFGDGSQTRDFTFVDDVTRVIDFVIENNISSELPINLAFGVRLSLNEVIEELSKYFPDLKVEYRDWRQGDVRDSQNSPESIRKIISELQPTPFAFALDQTIRWYKDNSTQIVNGPAVVD